MRHRTSERASQNDGKIMIKANSDWTLTHFWLFGPPPQWSHLTRPHWFQNFRPDQKMMIDCQHFETGIESETTKHENDAKPNWSMLLMVNHLISRIQHHLKMLASRQNRQFVFNENNINKNNMKPFLGNKSCWRIDEKLTELTGQVCDEIGAWVSFFIDTGVQIPTPKLHHLFPIRLVKLLHR